MRDLPKFYRGHVNQILAALGEILNTDDGSALKRDPWVCLALDTSSSGWPTRVFLLTLEPGS